jgi:signal transduction histidine kinase
LVQKNGGELTVESTVNEGSSFKISLPIRET